MDNWDFVNYIHLKAFRSKAPKVQDKEDKDQISMIQVGGIFFKCEVISSKKLQNASPLHDDAK